MCYEVAGTADSGRRGFRSLDLVKDRSSKKEARVIDLHEDGVASGLAYAVANGVFEDGRIIGELHLFSAERTDHLVLPPRRQSHYRKSHPGGFGGTEAELKAA